MLLMMVMLLLLMMMMMTMRCPASLRFGAKPGHLLYIYIYISHIYIEITHIYIPYIYIYTIYIHIYIYITVHVRMQNESTREYLGRLDSNQRMVRGGDHRAMFLGKRGILPRRMVIEPPEVG